MFRIIRKLKCCLIEEGNLYVIKFHGSPKDLTWLIKVKEEFSLCDLVRQNVNINIVYLEIDQLFV